MRGGTQYRFSLVNVPGNPDEGQEFFVRFYLLHVMILRGHTI